MKTINEMKIIGIDHGYGNIKTANHCFQEGMVTKNEQHLSKGFGSRQR